MPLYRVRQMWTALLGIGIPTAIAGVVWAAAFNGRWSAGALGAAYLLIAVAGRAHAAEMERRGAPMRRQRVSAQLERVRSTLPRDEDPPQDLLAIIR